MDHLPHVRREIRDFTVAGAGSASELALFRWHRAGYDTPAGAAWFTLAPPR